ncbi:MAG: TetR/AcrR family transcriptional regulator [Fluviicoccus sp.]|uniref:TetR/AcrR family transcriptional regulator n=1 Tax=Fluviicoccus sp. TaxID=2003552 RepID=UPI002725EBE0|nr:TetR/AcrR family transcriptional regulator [Fluviicoccus sp.]MDO8330077.1 TetR/AcrR family transcriptional regulator [Fluviicoccus sp.]
MRKQPQQERSRQMVSTLIEATSRCISRHGLDGTTTPLIAELAGVSVGSLYQYFDSKEALIKALIQKLLGDVTQALKLVPIEQNATVRDLVGNTIRLGFALLHSNEGLYLELVRNWHRLPTQDVADTFQQHFMEMARFYFLKHYREHPIHNLQVRLFIIINSTLFTTVRLLSQDNPFLNEEEVIQGLTDMIAGYLEGA